MPSPMLNSDLPAGMEIGKVDGRCIDPNRTPGTKGEEIERNFTIALQKRVSGHTMQEIADDMGVCVATVKSWLNRARLKMHEISKETADQMREIEVARLDYVVKRATEIAENSTKPMEVLAALDRIMASMEKRFDLFGLRKAVTVASQEITLEELSNAVRAGIRRIQENAEAAIEQEVERRVEEERHTVESSFNHVGGQETPSSEV